MSVDTESPWPGEGSGHECTRAEAGHGVTVDVGDAIAGRDHVGEHLGQAGVGGVQDLVVIQQQAPAGSGVGAPERPVKGASASTEAVPRQNRAPSPGSR